MLNGSIGLTSPQAKPSASRPTDCEAWIEVQGAINECNGWPDVWLKITEDVSYANEDIGIVASSLKRAPSKVDGLLPASLLILAPGVSTKLHVAMGSHCQSHSIVRITRERLL